MLKPSNRSIAILLCLALLWAFLPSTGAAENEAGLDPSVGSLYITGQKIWDDANDVAGLRPPSITINLFADGTLIDSQTTNAANEWRYSFDVSNRPLRNSQGNPFVYTVGENAIPHYSEYVADHVDPTVIFTYPAAGKDWKKYTSCNNLDIPLVSSSTERMIVVAKVTGGGAPIVVWTMDALTDPERSAITDAISRVNEIKEYGSIHFFTGYGSLATSGIDLLSHLSMTVTASMVSFRGTNEWSMVFEGTYSRGSVNATTSSLTNKLVPPKVSVQVAKSWQDGNNQDGIRPDSVTVKLLANGTDTGEPPLTLDAGNNWTATFTDLDEYAGGEKIVYTVAEASVTGYTSIVTSNAASSFTIANTHTPETIDISGSKTWDHGANPEDERPTSITINLNGASVSRSQTVTAADNWTWSFTGLPKYENGHEIQYTITEAPVKDYTPTYSGYNVANTYTPGKTSVQVTKSWNDANNQDGIRLDTVTVRLLAGGADTGKTLALNADNGWTATFTDLDEYQGGERIGYTIAEVSVPGYSTDITGDAANGFTITNVHTPETIDISGSKTWEDQYDQDGKRPDSITIRLMNGDMIVRSENVSADGEGNWAWSFTGLPRYQGGAEINYTISEDPVANYTTTYNGYNATNSYTPGQTSVQVTKVWQDNYNQDGIRPLAITVQLLANNVDTGQTATLNADNGWTATFTDLDEYQRGQKIGYTIAEVSVPGYSTDITGGAANGFTITNVHTPETITISGRKTWDDANDQDGKRPTSITINLLRDGEQFSSKTVTAADNWAWSFTGLPRYQGGTEINYTLSEAAVTNYTTTYNGYNVTNSYTLGKMSIQVTKSWRDSNNQDGIRPSSVTAELLADNVTTGKTLVLDATNNWTDTFTELDIYKAGQEIQYTIKEVTVAGYTTVITGNVASGFVVTNSHTPVPPPVPPVPEFVSVTGSKTWDDADNQDGKRPESIVINLLKNGQQIRSRTVTAEDGWRWSFAGLDKYDNGSEINYTISEVPVEGYTAIYNGYNVNNRYAPGKISVQVTKSWQDSDDLDGMRPDEVTVKLLADGADTGKTLVLNPNNNWTATFMGLDAYLAGQKVEYTLEEMSVTGYTTVISGDTASGFTITNSHTPEYEEIPEEDIPIGPPELPNTGGASPVLFYGFGLLLVALGVKYRRN